MNDRPRRLRSSAAMRELVAETRVTASALVQPHFVVAGDRADVAIPELPGISRMGVEPLLRRVAKDRELGIRTVLLFGVVDGKDARGSKGEDMTAPVHRALAALDREFGDDITLIADVCLCTYTDHGHCGLVQGQRVLNDESLPLLAGQARSLARAGADVIAPSDMMDGRVAAIRAALDADGRSDVAILSYAAKYASNFYGPFRAAADSAPKDGGPKNRKTYQMDYRNRREAVREALLDQAEGADVLMVKPALAYLDVIADVKAAVDRPVAAYLVSGEYAAVEALAEKGLADRGALVNEHLTAVKRAGADILISYHSRPALEHGWL
ncbi:MAG TPA: porphobilinogen synthase [Planctomycetota bacterium]|nr:porphobilinogen synthase [Planctomycetota bacterium]